MANDPIKAGSHQVSHPDGDPTLGKLVMDAQRDISSLISKEIALAKSELTISVKHGGLGLGLFVFALYLLIAGLLAFIGLRQVKQVKGPEKAIEQGKQIPSALKGRG